MLREVSTCMREIQDQCYLNQHALMIQRKDEDTGHQQRLAYQRNLSAMRAEDMAGCGAGSAPRSTQLQPALATADQSPGYTARTNGILVAWRHSSGEENAWWKRRTKSVLH